VKKLLLFILLFYSVFQAKAQIGAWTFKEPVIRIDFGAGMVGDVNTVSPYHYQRVRGSCPTDGHYTYTSYTSNCFRGDWFTLSQDHTPGDADGNFMLVNSSYNEGSFFRTELNGLKGATTYEFSVWMMNVCKISEKCPYPLLPNIVILLQTLSGKTIAQFSTGEVARPQAPAWKQYRAIFATPTVETSLKLIMVNNSPGGCGNDFAMDDITIRERILPPVSSVTPKKTNPIKKPSATVKHAPNKIKQPPLTARTETEANLKTPTITAITTGRPVFPPPPPLLVKRENSLIKQFETEAGEIRLDLYDNGEIDGDTVSIYHNNVLLVSRARLSQKPITFRIAVNAESPYHELVMVAENLGSIPPNTSVMIISAVNKRYRVYISSTEEKNAKVVLNLKE
jgi:hypothetical protein